jgi:cation diffusion facilitator CzcD-associated flavoprotein CzcO
VTTYTEEIKKITPRGFINASGEEQEVDVIICATGFNTSWIPRFPIQANGKNVQDLQARKPVSYLAIGVPESKWSRSFPSQLLYTMDTSTNM